MVIKTAKLAAADLVPPITLEQWGALEEPKRCELVNGRLVEEPEVALWHDFFLFDLIAFIVFYLKEHDLGVVTGITSKLKIGDFHGRHPDVFFIPKAQFHLIGENIFHGVPPWAAEVLSPNNVRTDRVEKFQEYATLGIGQYWIIDCPNKRIEIYALPAASNGQRAYQLIETVEGDVVFRPAIFPGLEIPLGQVWPTDFMNRPQR